MLASVCIHTVTTEHHEEVHTHTHTPPIEYLVYAVARAMGCRGGGEARTSLEHLILTNVGGFVHRAKTLL